MIMYWSEVQSIADAIHWSSFARHPVLPKDFRTGLVFQKVLDLLYRHSITTPYFARMAMISSVRTFFS